MEDLGRTGHRLALAFFARQWMLVNSDQELPNPLYFKIQFTSSKNVFNIVVHLAKRIVFHRRLRFY
jgi:hypothetical protein